MFEVRVNYPFEEWPDGDDRLEQAAGTSSHAGSNGATRDHGFLVHSFAEAKTLKEKIAAAFPNWHVTFREY